MGVCVSLFEAISKDPFLQEQVNIIRRLQIPIASCESKLAEVSI